MTLTDESKHTNEHKCGVFESERKFYHEKYSVYILFELWDLIEDKERFQNMPLKMKAWMILVDVSTINCVPVNYGKLRKKINNSVRLF